MGFLLADCHPVPASSLPKECESAIVLMLNKPSEEVFFTWGSAAQKCCYGEPRGIGREVGGGFGMGDTCTPVAD